MFPVLWLWLWALVLGAGLAVAQTTSQLPLQFDFLTPGARSLALGSAFVGAADDASTAFTNPAGLARLARREFSGELRFRRMETPFLQGGRVSGTATGIGPDTHPGPVYSVDIDEGLSPAFFCFVLPIARATIAVYAHQLVHTDSAFFSDGVFQRGGFLGVEDDLVREIPVGGSRQVSIWNYGGAVGFAVNDRLSIGAGLSLYTFDLAASFARHGVVSNVFSEADTNLVSATAVQDGDDIGVGTNWGVSWRATSQVKVGAGYRRGPEFQFTQRDQVFLSGLDVTRAGRFKVPDVFALGVEWRVADNIRALIDYDRVQYSQLENDFVTIQAMFSGRPDQLHVDNGNELHGGVEYQFLRGSTPFALRGGTWFDPDHNVWYEPTAAHDSTDVLMTATLPEHRGVMHYTFGGGVVFARRYELNMGADISSRTSYVTTSMVMRF